ncbi:MAG: RelA/SpoT domain-containing protein [Geobacteraceae bacterium]|nr:RelA/SpoT domain-containing protein [Geobacteraceae bacterium]
MKTSIESLQKEYRAIEGLAQRYASSLCEQIEHVLKENQIPLGVRIEQRIKAWESIAEKIERKNVELRQVSDMNDFIGIRLMLLFRRDVEKTCDLICRTFKLLEREDTVERLHEDQFGYQSFHLIVALPEDWLQIPSLKEFATLKAEIQIRTLAQHIWAAASHHLQYKREASVPAPVRRSIHRVSALLETVDLEFERVLLDRAEYITGSDSMPQDSPLDVDLLAYILDANFPVENKDSIENYNELREDLEHFGIKTAKSLTDLIVEVFDQVMEAEKKQLEEAKNDGYIGTSRRRSERGVFFTHVGLARQALAEKFGRDNWMAYASEKHSDSEDNDDFDDEFIADFESK